MVEVFLGYIVLAFIYCSRNDISLSIRDMAANFECSQSRLLLGVMIFGVNGAIEILKFVCCKN